MNSSNAGAEEIRIFKAFDTTLQLKSTATNILSQVRGGLGEEPWFMRALDDVAKLHPFVSGTFLMRCVAELSDIAFSGGPRFQGCVQSGDDPTPER